MSSTGGIARAPSGRLTPQEAEVPTAEARWRGLYLYGALAGIATVALIPIQVGVFIAWPPPGTVTGFFDLYSENWLLGLLSLDLLYLLSNTLFVPFYLALHAVLRRTSESAALLALVLGLVGIAAYFSSNPTFEMLSLSQQYAVAATDTDRTALFGAGAALLAGYKGTAFDVYYVLNAAALLIFASLMLRGNALGRPAAYTALASGILMIVPSTAGNLGLAMAMASLLPAAAMALLIARRLLRLARTL